jgi:hypothetical protein
MEFELFVGESPRAITGDGDEVLLHERRVDGIVQSPLFFEKNFPNFSNRPVLR